MNNIEEVTIIEINKPNKKQVQNRLNELCLFLSENLIIKSNKQN